MHILVYMSIVAPGKPSLLFYCGSANRCHPSVRDLVIPAVSSLCYLSECNLCLMQSSSIINGCDVFHDIYRRPLTTLVLGLGMGLRLVSCLPCLTMCAQVCYITEPSIAMID